MQDKIIEFLKRNENHISGEEISRSLNISRTAIWKYIEGLREEFGDAVTYAEPESARALAETIVELARNPNQRKMLGKIGREFVEKDHSWFDVTKKITLVLEKLLYSKE